MTRGMAMPYPATLRCFIEEIGNGEIGEFLREMAPQAGLEPATLR
jgi:hypothetical protein